jgi:hypothetical protein
MTNKVTKLSDVKRARAKAKERARKKMTPEEIADENLFALVDALQNAPEEAEEMEDESPRFLGDHNFPVRSSWFLSGQVLVRVLFVDRPVYVDMVDDGWAMFHDEERTFGRAYTAEITGWSLDGKTRYFKEILDPASVEHRGVGLFEISIGEEVQKSLVFDIERISGMVKSELACRSRRSIQLAELLDRTLYLPDRRAEGGSGPIHLIHLIEVGEPLFVSQARERSRTEMESMTPDRQRSSRRHARAVRHIMEQIFGPAKKVEKKPRLQVVK